MFKRVLVVMENEKVNTQAVYYARELAQRMDSEVSFLMLVEMASLDRTWLGSSRGAISELDDRVGRQMAELSEDFLRLGIATSAALRVGDPKQELFKFLAERPPFQVLIWGSHEELPGGASRGHWMAKAAASLECPLWTVSSRRSS
ncbi:MAG: universal stress protein [Desulfarculaceae bacterium]|nr:universal stress protein [Desulfarculaceae bacterium]MCF8072151.1 universal stress protein [Desulfarculaceae bacterium]MCF8100072.1 universal stress protein [Desulfarculaceae bacterium]MCF8118501.1 universal stress protein [Desulfarculaceae bacterium]